jgi:hypothetical protein
LALSYELDVIRELVSARTTQDDTVLFMHEKTFPEAVEDLSKAIVEGFHEQGYRLTTDPKYPSVDD